MPDEVKSNLKNFPEEAMNALPYCVKDYFMTGPLESCGATEKKPTEWKDEKKDGWEGEEKPHWDGATWDEKDANWDGKDANWNDGNATMDGQHWDG